MSNRPTANRPTKTHHVSRQEMAKEAGSKAPIIIGVLIVMGLIALVVALMSGNDDEASSGGLGDSTAVLKEVNKLTPEASAKVGTEGALSVPEKINAPALTKDGKPVILYVGGEFCPFCAATRWPMVMALSRFGTFSKIGLAQSSPQDTAPNTKSFSFHGSEYSSEVISFQGFEIFGETQQTKLDELPAEYRKVVDEYSTGGIPFMNFGGKATASTAVNPELMAGKTAMDIAKESHDPSTEIGKATISAANAMTKAICLATGDKPEKVCSAPEIKAAKLDG